MKDEEMMDKVNKNIDKLFEEMDGD